MKAFLQTAVAAGLAFVVVVCGVSAQGDEPATKESPLVKMLRSGKVPEERQGAIVDMVGKRGNAADVLFLIQKATAPDGFSPALRLKALNAVTEAATTREVRPEGAGEAIGKLLDPKADPQVVLAAVRLAAALKAGKALPQVAVLAETKETSSEIRAAALDALASIGGTEAKSHVDALTKPGRPVGDRATAVAALLRLDPDAGSGRAAELLQEATGKDDLTPLVSAFLNRRDGADRLAAILGKTKVSADASKVLLREVYTLGRSDAALVGALTKAAGLDAEVKPLDSAAMDKLIADVNSRGNAARGESIFRRADVNCSKCHALSGAGGGVGPELSAIGVSSPVDYLVNSLMLPDQAIKEEFRTLVVLTTDGQVYQGIVADKDDKRTILREATGTLRTVPASEIDETKEGGSLMPKGLVNFLTRDEVVDLVRFLSELGKPGAYAVRSVPTIQRWRFLKPVPDELAVLAPEDAFRSRVEHSPPDLWFPAYARVAGDLPLDEVATEAGSRVLFLRADVEVSQAGKVAVNLDRGDGVNAWVDDQPAPSGAKFETELSAGRHTLTFRADTGVRSGKTLRATVMKPAGSTAEYVVVGGK